MATSWRDRKYAGQGNRRPRSVPPQPRHADDGHCHCDQLRQALATRQVTTITTWTGPDGKPHPITDRETARQVKNRAYTCGSAIGVSLIMSEAGLGIVDLGNSRWGFRFRPVDPASAKTHVEARRQHGDELAYEHLKGERRPRPPRKGKRQIEAEQIAAHRPLVQAMRQVIEGDDSEPVTVPPIPPAPPGYDAITGQRIDPRHAVTIGGEQIGTVGQVLMELMRGKLEQAERDRQLLSASRGGARKR